jgi:hypothetical protein
MHLSRSLVRLSLAGCLRTAFSSDIVASLPRWLRKSSSTTDSKKLPSMSARRLQ